jgi:CheY-like chemotaxis protein
MPKKILLADDSLTIQKVVELTFSDSDYELTCVSNGQKALDRLRDDRPDLILADVVMPEKNGYEVCEAIKSNPATARIPVMLLSGTFEPFDRERAERIGADAIVSKPFDSQQLIAQVEALLDRPPSRGSSAASEPASMKVPVTAPEATSPESEEAPFDVGFSAEDFTAAIRIPPRGLDPFEEEYGKGDVDSAIEAFERSRPEPAIGGETAEIASAEPPPSDAPEEGGREPLAQWLRDEPEKAAEGLPFPHEEESPETEIDTEATVSIASLALPDRPADEAPTAEIPQQTVAMKLPPVEEPLPDSEESASDDDDLFERAEEESPRVTMEPPAAAPESPHPIEAAPAAEVPHDIEMLAQTSSIPELTQMLSSVAKSAGGDLSDDQIEKLARRVVEKLSDRIVREIAWEVIPDMAEIVIKRRIKELEADVD